MYQLSPTCTRKATLKVQSGGGSPWNGRLACYELLKVLALRKTPPVMHEICPYVRLRAHHAARPSCCHPSLLLKSHRQPPGPVFASWHDEVPLSAHSDSHDSTADWEGETGGSGSSCSTATPPIVIVLVLKHLSTAKAPHPPASSQLAQGGAAATAP
eukprot:jgi/Mesen1/736/ME000110S_11008